MIWVPEIILVQERHVRERTYSSPTLRATEEPLPRLRITLAAG